MRVHRVLMLVIVISLVSAAGAQADVAQLRNGRWLEVTGYRLEGESIVLHLRGGGEMALPAYQVREIRRVDPHTGLLAPHGGTRADLPTEGDAAPPPSTPETSSMDIAVTQTESAQQFVSPFDRTALREMAAQVARRHGVSERFVQAVIQVESHFDTFALSPRGAMGLMQLMPETAARFDVENAFDPLANVEGGVRYLKELLERYSGEWRLVLAAYNAGEEAVERYSGIPPYRETVQYVDRVLRQVKR